MRAAPPHATVEVWAQDEHRIGLKPVRRRVWLLPDMDPIAPIWPRYQWMTHRYCFVRRCCLKHRASGMQRNVKGSAAKHHHR